MTTTEQDLCDPHAENAPVKLFTTPRCAYCMMAKRLLASRGISYEEVNVQGLSEVRAWLAQVSQQYTVPQIFIHGQSIGGFTELRALDRAQELHNLVRQSE